LALAILEEMERGRESGESEERKKKARETGGGGREREK
jgi:hypothetical protein